VIHPPFGPNRTCWGSNVIAPQSLGGVRRLFVALTLSDWTLDMRLTTSLRDSSGQWSSTDQAMGDTCSAVRCEPVVDGALSGRESADRGGAHAGQSAGVGYGRNPGANLASGSRAHESLAQDRHARARAAQKGRPGRHVAGSVASRSFASSLSLLDVSGLYRPSPRGSSARCSGVGGSARGRSPMGGAASPFSSLGRASSSLSFHAVRSRIATVQAPRVGRRRIDRP
jgi:hypothetical protein